MASLLYTKDILKGLEVFTNDLVRIINKRKSSGFDDVELNDNFMKGRSKTALQTISKSLGELGYKNNLTDVGVETYKISW